MATKPFKKKKKKLKKISFSTTGMLKCCMSVVPKLV